MNIQQRIVKQTETPQPIRFTADAYFEMAPVLNVRFEKTELRDGTVYEIPIDGPLTRQWNMALNEWLVTHKGADIGLINHQTLPLGEFWAPSPDHYLFARVTPVANVNGANVLLVIEVSDSSLASDLGEKAEAYAEHGVREYWVIDPNGHRIFVHRLRSEDGYGEPRVAEFGDRVDALLVPGLSLRLADLKDLG